MGIAELQRALRGYRALLLDTMVFSYHLGDHPVYAPLTDAILSMVEQGSLLGLTTTITVAELLTRPAQEGNLEAMRDYRLYLANFPNLQIAPVDLLLAEKAALVRAETRLKMPDAIQVAAAQLYSADTIITNDRAWLNRFPAPSVTILDDFVEPARGSQDA